MSSQTKRIPFGDELPAVFSGLSAGTHVLQVETPDGPLDMRFVKAADPKVTNLMVVFHGSADRSKRMIPIFVTLPPMQTPAHVLSVADPSLALSPDLRLAWYAGHQGFDTQGWLKRIIAALRTGVPVSRTVYFGTSGGGFAALVASHGDPGSVAVVGNPQTVFETYAPELVQAYRQICWPDAPPETPLGQLTCTNVGQELYGKGFANTVIYVQSVGDRPHFERQLIPFVTALRGARSKSNFILHSDFWGTLGHVLATEEYLEWINAAFQSSTTQFDAILLQRHKIREVLAISREAPRPAELACKPGQVITPVDPETIEPMGTKRSPPPFRASDLQIAARLTDWMAQH